jgi:hypothetical protein
MEAGAFTGLQLAALVEIGARQVLGLADGGFGFGAEGGGGAVAAGVSAQLT